MTKNNKSPLKSSPLRIPGQSVEEKIKKIIDDEASQYILMPLMVVVMASMEWWHWYLKKPPEPVIFTFVAIIIIIFSVFKLVKIRRKLENLKLGKDGEIAVGQFLEQFRKDNFKIFHDVIGQNKEDYNIDHVLIGEKGIFTIETKTYSKPSKGDAVVIYDGKEILINGQKTDRDIVAQAKAQSAWLSDILKTVTGKRLSVKPTVLFPGWYIKNTTQKKSNLWVLNPKSLPAFVSNEPNILTSDEVKFIASNLSKFIRESNKKP